MSILSKLLSKTGGKTVPYDCIRNNGRTLVIGGTISELSNTLVDYWDLVGYEKQSASTEIISPGRFSGEKSQMGFICSEYGITVSLVRKGTKPEREVIPEFILTKQEWLTLGFKMKTVPYVEIRNNGRTIFHGGKIGILEKDRDHIYLLNDPAGPIYRVMSEKTEIIEDGISEMGYVCDESGRTVTIDTYITITKPDPIPNNNITEEGNIDRSQPPAIGDDLKDVKIEARYEGIVGKLVSLDKLVDIFDLGQSSRKFWFGLFVGLVMMFLLTRFF